jgi:hypothetical protein
MITLTPVLERWSFDCPFWQVEPTDFTLAVPRTPTPQQVGTAIWALIGRSVTADDLSITATDAAEAIERYLAGGDEDSAPGGLRIESGDVVIEPGCCIGLDEWRGWLRIVDGEVIDLGHNPDGRITHLGPVARIWTSPEQHPQPTAPGPDDPYIDIHRAALPGLLTAVQQDLAGFLTAVHPWAYRIRADLADRLIANLDHRLEISAPLGV